MGWIQFIQIAKEASWHDSSLYLIQGLVLSLTSYMAKWGFLHLLLIMKRTLRTYTQNMCSICVTLTLVMTISLAVNGIWGNEGHCLFWLSVDATIPSV